MVQKKVHPYILIILTFIGVIALGTLLLSFPFASTNGSGFGFIDSLFMATSAVCVTGLSVMNVAAEMTVYGKVVMGLLMEIGGLSIITIAVFFFVIIGGKISVSNRFLLREALNQNSVKGIVALVIRIIKVSFIIQVIGIVLNMFALMPYVNNDFFTALGYSTFHSIASFNNAGFDIFGSESMIAFKDNVMLNLSTIFLIVTGSTGFIVFDEILRKKNFKKLSLHSKISLITTGLLIISGMLLIKLSMYKDVTWLQALFTSVTTRTAGFTTVDMANLSPGAYITTVVLMFIGASPCSTGGGIKTTTFAVILIAIVFFARGKKPKVFGRKISDYNSLKAFVLFTVAVLLVFVASLVVGSIQPELGTKQTIFEVVSAFSTTGLSMGITSSLNGINRIIMVILMFLGRIGPLTVIGVLNKNWISNSKEEIQYVEESVIIG